MNCKRCKDQWLYHETSAAHPGKVVCLVCGALEEMKACLPLVIVLGRSPAAGRKAHSRLAAPEAPSSKRR